MTDGCIVECQYYQGAWFPVNLRTDKTHPNNRRTYYNTLTNIKEDIQWQEFCTVRGNKKPAPEAQRS